MPNPNFLYLLAPGLAVILLLQVPAFLILLARLLPGIRRPAPLKPALSQPEDLAQVTIVVPTLNEVLRLGPCLAGLSRQGYEVREILVVDSHSQDGTDALVKAAQAKDPRIRLKHDPPLPADWVGRPWALHNGYLFSSPDSEWILGIDADIRPQTGLVASLVQTARAENLDVIGLSPRFILKYPGEWWLQPALLMTLIYRFGAAAKVETQPERALTNGQCLLIRRSLLTQLNGYTCAQQSFCDDVSLVRACVAVGAKVAFRDGKNLIQVRMYEGLGETWQEWGRSLDLKDATPRGQLWGDLWFLTAVQGLPLIMSLMGLGLKMGGVEWLTLDILLALNLGLLAMRWGMVAAVSGSYLPGPGQGLLWLSPLADTLAVWRIIQSSMQQPKSWRGRSYQSF
ncbi:glycosyltransferase family 2 protein [Thermosynechococcaceae cyanobacterium BACA0444]|uniref:4,4'-diaponeurosporenoate glycosyltransferase n=1 Tax=Pseudocalidococcus azoricus BACA0444 TaxID=2918990 RepID=A0AAE4FNW1_9CYAN|nr:glycosyltransferase family 2 protein [Pseudocalidococcus azoricus]MDS3859400.1 glycosyltransferase family 2 protein [Pseudocalidococcus azoricus BACA0444]